MEMKKTFINMYNGTIDDDDDNGGNDVDAKNDADIDSSQR
jgi:hypothetical protein